MSDDNDWTWMLDCMDEGQKRKANVDMSVGYARSRYDDYDNIVDSHKWKGKELDKINSSPDPGETAYKIAKAKTEFHPTPIEDALKGNRAATGKK